MIYIAGTWVGIDLQAEQLLPEDMQRSKKRLPASRAVHLNACNLKPEEPSEQTHGNSAHVGFFVKNMFWVNLRVFVINL